MGEYSYVFSFRMVFFYLVGMDFSDQLNVRIQSINQIV